MRMPLGDAVATGFVNCMAQNSRRKLVYLMPTLVNPGGSQDGPLGHLYFMA
jgi:hypothetical protein